VAASSQPRKAGNSSSGWLAAEPSAPLLYGLACWPATGLCQCHCLMAGQGEGGLQQL